MASNDSSFAEHGPAMTQEDVRQVFGNIAEVALFADTFVDRIEDALGNVLAGGVGPDRVGALFLDIVCLRTILERYSANNILRYH